MAVVGYHAVNTSSTSSGNIGAVVAATAAPALLYHMQSLLAVADAVTAAAAEWS